MAMQECDLCGDEFEAQDDEVYCADCADLEDDDEDYDEEED